MADKEKGWLGCRIKEAQVDFASWPKWMQKSAHFEGYQREGELIMAETPEEPRETELGHLGDGVYLSHDGYQFWLAANHHTNKVIALEPAVWDNLKYAIKRFETQEEEKESA